MPDEPVLFIKPPSAICDAQQGCCQTKFNTAKNCKTWDFPYAAKSPLHSESELLLCCLKISRFCKCRWWLKWL
ncbi:MAG: hypothetical protein ACI9LY_000271 [Arenicella sp.]|jgi:hypothetical protein